MTKIIGKCRANCSARWGGMGADVSIISLDLSYLDDTSLFESSFGELRAYFDTATWDVHQLGDIYTDKQWMSDFKRLLVKNGFSERAVEAIEYSESGMQGENFVSMDVGDPFIIECDQFYNFVEGKKPKKIEITVSALD